LWELKIIRGKIQVVIGGQETFNAQHSTPDQNEPVGRWALNVECFPRPFSVAKLDGGGLPPYLLPPAKTAELQAHSLPGLQQSNGKVCL
jgi:hypothetical protein